MISAKISLITEESADKDWQYRTKTSIVNRSVNYAKLVESNYVEFIFYVAG